MIQTSDDPAAHNPEHWSIPITAITEALLRGDPPVVDRPETPEHRAARRRTDGEQLAVALARRRREQANRIRDLTQPAAETANEPRRATPGAPQ